MHVNLIGKLEGRDEDLLILIYILFKIKNFYKSIVTGSVEKIPDPEAQKSLDPDPHPCLKGYILCIRKNET